MAGVLDWLINDPTRPGGGFLAQLLGTTPATGLAGGLQRDRSLLGDSPFADAVRGGLAGLVASQGYRGPAAFGAGMLGAERYNQQRRELARQNAIDDLELARQRGSMNPGTSDPSGATAKVAVSQAGKPAGCRCGTLTSPAAGGSDGANGTGLSMLQTARTPLEQLQALSAELQLTPEGRAMLQRLAAEIASSRGPGLAENR